jgi:site-specific DNA-methyltransferase (adenine-specific)
MTVSRCLQEYETGGIRRYPNDLPFEDVIESERTPRRERDIVDHPSLKPQSLLRRLTYAVLPLGKGIIADPFMGSGSTIAAAEAVGISAVGIERHRDFFAVASSAVDRLRKLRVSAVDSLLNINHEQRKLFMKA